MRRLLITAAAIVLMAGTAHADFFSDAKDHALAKNAVIVELFNEHCEPLPQAFLRKTAQALEAVQQRWIIQYRREEMTGLYWNEPITFCPGMRAALQSGLEAEGFTYRLRQPNMQWGYRASK